jgi:alkyl sulfatase BDS1-like metallo-beta-lactamase superfamily hydrolase
LESHERAARLVQGFGGAEKVARLVDEAVETHDLRWALELSSWLVVRHDGTSEDRERLAAVLRHIGNQSTAANIRNWCLTTARDLDGSTDQSRLRVHRLREGQVLKMSPFQSLRILRVLLDPERAAGMHQMVGFDFDSGISADLVIRNCVSVVSEGRVAENRIALTHEIWAKILGGRSSMSDALAHGVVTASGSQEQILEMLSVFENPGLRS